MGWCIVVAWRPLTAAVPPAGVAWLVAGGVIYSVGVVFYALDRRFRWAHPVWHLFVLAGSAAISSPCCSTSCQAGRRPRLPVRLLRRHQHGVDHLDDPVGGADVGLDDLRVVDRDRPAADCDRDRLTFRRSGCFTSFRSAEVQLEVRTWYLSTFASFALSFASASSVSFGTFANASSVGAKTVNGPGSSSRR